MTLGIANINGYAQTVAFPGAEGFGKYASGGRGGEVAEVTSLEDDGPGSLRQALAAYPGAPLTVVFRLSGIIDLKSPLVIKRSALTIAGQTAPGDGICLKGHSLILNGAAKNGNHGNIIIRYIRSRPGSKLQKGVYGFDMENCHDVIVDHCSFSWANEECAAMYDTKNTTLQWCIISEGLYDAGHMKGHRGYGGVWGGQFASYHHNLIAHQNSRAVRFNGGRAHDTMALIDYRNNVIYNWGNENAAYGGDVKLPGAVSQVNMVNNYYKPGPATPAVLKFIQVMDAGTASTGVTGWFLSGNTMNGSEALTKNNWLGADFSALPPDKKAAARADQSFTVKAPVTTQAAAAAYEQVLNHAGANLPIRDSIDRRLVHETQAGTATGKGSFGKAGIIDDPAAVGGWPVYKSLAPPVDNDHDGMADDWERKHALDPADPQDRNKRNSDGYTMLEKYLNEGFTIPQSK